MTPTSALAGVLTGLVDGLIIAVAVFLIVMVNNRRHRSVPVEVHPVADDPQSDRPLSPGGSLHRAA